jgi:lipooligosaccharide transport system permease protein
MLPTHRALQVWRRNLESWKRFAPAFFVSSLGSPIFYLLAIGYGLGRYVAEMDGVPYAVFLTPGLIAFTAMNTATFETTIGAFTRMTEQRTYTAILATPCSVGDVVAGDIVWAASKSVIAVAIVVILAVGFGLLASPLAAVALVPTGFAIGLLFGGLGMLVTARAASYDSFNYYFTLGISLMVLFAGVFFPLDSLPSWARALAWMLPLTHAVSLCRAIASGHPGPLALVNVGYVVVTTGVAFVLAERGVRKRVLV